ncbi:pericentrin isoform X3 [Rhinatrema bivittatum]|uniref:pericentrin isoform X3 n=1 Tax=Rhinatrema bivittatum TaxID=194408 RepID=UPI00112D6223|nr:pericentrin isoform X3 [Rhinatrema bivittatum]
MIAMLQEELAQLGSVCHEAHDCHNHLGQSGLVQTESQLKELSRGPQEGLAEVKNLQKELKTGSQDELDSGEQAVTAEHTVKKLWEKLELVCTSRETLQQLFEEKESKFKLEKKILDQSLQTVQELNKHQEKEFTSLKAQYEMLQEEYDLLKTHLSKKDAEMRIISSHVQGLEDSLRAKESTLMEKELHLKTLKEQRVVYLELMTEKNAELAKRDACHQPEAEERQAHRSESAKLELELQTAPDCQLETDVTHNSTIKREVSDELHVSLANFEQFHSQQKSQGGTETGDALEPRNLQEQIAEKKSKIPTPTEDLQSLQGQKNVHGSWPYEQSSDLMEGNIEDFSLSQSAFQEYCASLLESARDEYGSHAISNLGDRLSWELEESKHLDVQFLAYLQHTGMAEDGVESGKEMEVTGLEQLSPQLQALLDKVHKESCSILACSEYPFIYEVVPGMSQRSTGLESWQQERLSLCGIIESLKELLINAIDKGGKDAEDAPCDWRKEMFHKMQGLFEKERISLCNELYSHLYDHSSGDQRFLVEKLEHIVNEKEEQQQLVLEHLLSLDRSSLLAEIQDLRAQLRMTHLQNQEKLQQLQESVTSAEEHGSKREHQLRKQVELLEYKRHQEISMVNDLQCSLSRQQEQLAEKCQHLKEEQNTTSILRKELCDCNQKLERLLSSHQALQQEISRLSYALESKEQDLLAAIQSLQGEREKGKALTEQEQHQNHHPEDQKTNTVKDLKITLEAQNIQNKQLSIALEHEQASNSNLRKELQIEYSRCGALLSQEKSKLSEFQHILTLERQCCEDLAATVNYEQAVLEQLAKKHQGPPSNKKQETLTGQSFVQELQAQLKEEKKRTVELADKMEKTQQHAVLVKRQAEVELQISCDKTQKEKEFSKKLQSALKCLQREKEARLMRERERGKQDQQTMTDQGKDWERDEAMLQELELQHQKDHQKIKELQRRLIELAKHKQEQEDAYSSMKSNANDHELCSPSIGTINLQKLEKAQKQLLFTAIHLKKFMHNVDDRSTSALSDGASMASLLHTLGELKSELKNLSSTARPSHDPAILTDVLLLENKELTKSVTSLTEEKLKLKREKEYLENNLQHYLCKGAAGEQVKRLYMKYLRAERFRKALVYQKKYLLMLLGGFQDCEQATLSLIARMGIYPSHRDLQVSSLHSHAFSKFRSAVRAIIAISRLGFLVKKWHKMNRNRDQIEGHTQNIVHRPVLTGTTPTILGHQQQSSIILNSPQAQDTASCHRVCSATLVSSTAKSSQNSVSLESSLASTQDPEKSLTEYIQHLEVIQQRLGGLQGIDAKKGCQTSRNMCWRLEED